MAEELTIEEAKKLVAKFSNPEHKNKEHELFQSAAAKLLEEINPDFEFEYEYEEESEEVQEGSQTEVELNNFDKNAFEKIKEYTSDVFRNIQGLGAAGMVTFSSAAYFQANEAFETTRGINTVIQQTEANYGESLFSYIVSAIKGEKSQPESESESESEETTEESSVQSTPEASVQSTPEAPVQSDSGIESDNQQEQPKDSDKNEQREESKDEESDIETNSSETKPDLQTDPVQSETNDSGDIDPIKPHQDFFPEPVITPNDAIIVSPEGVY